MTLSVDNFDLLDPGPQQVWPDLGGGPWRYCSCDVGWAGANSECWFCNPKEGP